MSEYKFWVRIWALVALVVCTLIVGISTYNINYTNVSLEMIKNGIAPEAVQCALGDTFSRNPVCVVLASGK